MKLLKDSACQIINGFKLSPASFLIIEALSSLQIIHLIFKNMSFNFQSDEVVLSSFSKSTYYLTGTFELKENVSFIAGLKILWGFYTSYLGCFILLHLLAISQIFSSKKLTKKVSRFLGILYLVHSRVLFFPIQFFFVGLCCIYKSNLLTIDDQFLQSSTWFIINIILSVINCCLALPKEFILFQITEGENFDAIKTNVFHKGIFIYKCVFIVLQFVFENNKAYLGLSSIFQFIFFWSLFSYYRIKLPIYNFRLLKFCAIMNAIWLCLAFIAIFQAFGTSSQLLGGLQLYIILLPILGVRLVLSQFKIIFTNILKGKLLSKDQVLHFGLLLSELTLPEHISQLSDKRFFPDFHVVIGILANKGIDVKYGRMQMNYEEQLYQCIIERLEKHLIKFPKSPEVLLFLVDLYWKTANIAKFIENFRKIEKMKLNFRYRNAIEKFQVKLKSLYQEDLCQDTERIKLANYFRYKKLTSTLKQNMLEEISLHNQFWKDIENRKLDINKNIIRTQTIDSLFFKIENIYEKESEALRQNFLPAFLLHVVYLNKVRNLITEGNKKFCQFQSAYSHKISQHLYKVDFEETAVVVVSLNKKNVGQILEVSDSFRDMFHIPKAKLFESNFNCLFPNGIAQFYQTEIEKYSRAPTYKLDTKYDTYGKTAEGQIFELEAHFQFHCQLDHELAFIIKLKKISPYLPIIVANRDGIVKDYSKTLKNSSVKLNYENVRKIQNLNVEFEEVNKAFNFIFTHPKDVTQFLNKRTNYSFDNSKNQSLQVIRNRPKTNSYSDSEIFTKVTKENHLVKDQSFTNDLKDSNRPLKENLNTSRISIKEIELETSRNQDTQLEGIYKDKAFLLCQRFIKGENVVLHEPLDNVLNKNIEIEATIKIKPYTTNGEVYKIVYIENLRRRNFPNIQSNDQKQFQSCEFPTGKGIDEIIEGDKITPRCFFVQTDQDSIAQKKLLLSSRTKEGEALGAQVFRSGNLKEDSELNDEKLWEKQNNIDGEGKKGSQTMFSSKEIRGMKMMQEISNNKKIQPLLKLFIGILYLLFLFIPALASLNYYLSQSATKEVETGINIVNAATQRDINVIQAWQYTLYLYLSAYGELIPQTGSPSIQVYLRHYIESLKLKTNELKNFISSLNQESLMKYFLEKDIVFWFDSSDSIPFRAYDTFEATDYLLSKFLFFSNYPNFGLSQDIEEIPYILNNTANDFLIKSTSLTSTTKEHFRSLISDNILILNIGLVLECFALLLLSLSLMALAFIIRQTYIKFFSVIAKVKERSVQQRLTQLNQVRVLLEQDIEEKSILGKTLNFIGKENYHNVQENPHHNASKPFSINPILVTKCLNHYLQKQVVFAITFISLLFGLFISSLLRSISSFRTLENINNRISVLSEMYRQFVLITSTYTYQTTFSQNPEFLVFYKSPKDQVMESLEGYTKYIDLLSETFLSKENDQKDSFLGVVLQQDICLLLPSDEYVYCHDWVSKAGNQGFISVNYYFLQNTRDYIMIYQNDPTPLSALQVSAKFTQDLSDIILLMETSFTQLTIYVINNLEFVVNEELLKNTYYLFGILFTICVYLLFLCNVSLKRFQIIDLAKRKIIKIIPYNIIQENKILSFYIVQKYSDEVEGLKGIF